jgi:hypothetical protein
MPKTNQAPVTLPRIKPSPSTARQGSPLHPSAAEIPIALSSYIPLLSCTLPQALATADGDGGGHGGREQH